MPEKIDLKQIATQLGGSVEVFRKSLDDASDGAVASDSRVPSLDVLRGKPQKAGLRSAPVRASKRIGVKGKAKPSDFSVHFRAPNTDGDSKVAIVSGKTKKVAFEQG